ncbi:MAG: glycosyltransferase [Xenococcaceae cyanobacterium MO_188.B32]|nr:glycosyltransferase [Xenococcaceae cyanobacterium MO_188.B32]
MIKILFITPTARQTGSEIVLYNLLSNLNKQDFKAVGLVSKLNGVLLDRLFNDIDIPTYSFESYLKKLSFLINQVGLSLLKKKNFIAFHSNIKQYLFHCFLQHIHNLLEPDYWYINTLVIPEALEYACLHNIPCIVHSHELEQMLVHLSDRDVERIINYPKLIIACSNTAANMLRILGRDRNLEICFSSINTSKIIPSSQLSQKIRNNLGIKEKTFLWANSGSTDTNKNPLLFVEIAANLLKKQKQNIHFMWIGNNPSSGLDFFAKQYAKHLGIADRITWTGILSSEEYYNHLYAANGLVVTSTKESLSAVSIEALYLQKPIVSFDCGGTKEIIQDNLGYVVNSWNITDIVNQMIQVMNDNLHFCPEKARKQAIKYDINLQAVRWNQILNQYIL